MHPHDADARGIADGDWVGVSSRVGSTVLRAVVTDRVPMGVVYTTFHFPESGANVVTTENSDWATNCPEYKVTAVEIRPSAAAAVMVTEAVGDVASQFAGALGLQPTGPVGDGSW